MNIIAFILIIIAIAIFLCAHLAVPRRWATVSLGLVFFASAVLAHFVLSVEPIVRVD